MAVALCLVAIKAWAYLTTDSLAVAASLIDSALDLLASGAALIGIAYAAKPPDDDHAFGHSSVEDLVALGQSVLITFSSLGIAWRAIASLPDPEPMSAGRTGLMLMGVSFTATLGLVVWQSVVIRRTGSKIVTADRLHYLSDLVPTAGAIAALYVSERYGIGWPDPVIALVACTILLYGAWNIGSRAWDALMDRRADTSHIRQIERILADAPGVIGHHDLKTRTAGSRIFVQVHLELDGTQSLRDAHAIGARVRHQIMRTIPGADTIIHKDPV